MKPIESIGIQAPTTYLPRRGIELTRWAVIACDQFTSEPEYWAEVEKVVGTAPSTFNLVLPEVFIGKPEEQFRLKTIQENMRRYLAEDVLEAHDGFIYVERQTAPGKIRKGLVLALDLECYDYTKGSSSLVRATEGTILDRLPPRIKIREAADLELPHIIVLIDDPQGTVIEPLAGVKDRLTRLYDFDLMLGSGHLAGYQVDDGVIEQQIIHSLERLADPQAFHRKYQVGPEQPVLLFAMGDGNHSLATAKAIWEKIKRQVGMDHPARYALVEIENVHDEAIDFEPIHRVLFQISRDPLQAVSDFFSGQTHYHTCHDQKEMVAQVNAGGSAQRVGVIRLGECGVVEIRNPISHLAVGSLQNWLDTFLKAGGAETVDYVHGEEVLSRLGCQPGNMGFYLPAMHKSDLFKTVILDGALPRKTFSMGEAREKRFYMEARKLTD